MPFSYLRCEALITRLTDAVTTHAGDGDDVPIAIVVDALREEGITISDFIELDERPGRFDHRYEQTGWYRLLRRVRNDQTVSLFEVLAR